MFFFHFQSDGEDELKKRQLMELAIINGTYRDSQSKNSSRKYSHKVEFSACYTKSHSLPSQNFAI